MDKQQEKAFSDFLESENTDNIFDNFQDLVRKVFVAGYRKGIENTRIQIIYIIKKKKAEE